MQPDHASRSSAVPPEPRSGGVAARVVGLLLFAAAATAAAVLPLWLEGALTPVAARETAPLAALLGGAIGWSVVTRWPASFGSGAALGALAGLVTLVLFCFVYLSADAVIEAWRGGRAGQAIAEAVERLGARLPVGAPLAIVGFALAGGVAALIGSAGRAIGRRRAPARR